MPDKKNLRITRRELIGGLSAIGAYSALGLPSIARGESGKKKSEQGYPVNIFLGTGGHGHTYPGATVPFGMVQLSPDT